MLNKKNYHESDSDEEMIDEEIDSDKEKKYPKLIIKSIKDYKFINSKQNWNKRFNLRTNEYLQNKVFGHTINLKNDIYAFSIIDQIGIALNPGEKTVIFGYEKNDGTLAWLVCSLEAVKELITIKQNYLHELIYDLPIRMFLDIEYNVENPKKFGRAKKRVLSLIDEFKDSYKNYMKKTFDIKIVDNEWLELTSHKKSKVSFHLLGDHIHEGKLIYFKNIYHLKYVIKKIKELIKSPFYKGISIDESFYFKKPLRMYFCAYRKEKERIFFNEKTGRIFNVKEFKRSILQLHPGVVNLEFVEINMCKNFKDEKEVRRNLKFKKNTNLKQLIPSSSKSLQNGVNEIANKLLKKLIFLLIKIDKFTHQRYGAFDFGFLKKCKNEFEVYRVRKGNEPPFSLFVDLRGSLKCLIQDYDHTHYTGRILILNPINKKISVWCAGCKNTTRKSYFAINANSEAAIRYKVKKYFDLLIKNCN